MRLSRPLPRFEFVMSLEMLVSAGAIALVIGVLAAHAGVPVRQAELTRVFAMFGNDKSERMINMALTGEGYYPGSPLPPGLALPPGDELPQFYGTKMTERSDGNTLRFEGEQGKHYLTFAPSVVAAGPIGSVMWLCGNQKAPAGWTQPANTGTDLPPAVLPHTCLN